MLTKIKKIGLTIYKYTHLAVGAGAVVVSFLSPQSLPPSIAAGVVLLSQALKIANDWLLRIDQGAPAVEAAIEGIIKTQATGVTEGTQATPDPADPNAPKA